ncbi:hypothetical protein [Helicobacter cinaedi]|nr:hypothetical protein [Helicobacter cinaedi]
MKATNAEDTGMEQENGAVEMCMIGLIQIGLFHEVEAEILKALP